MAAVSGSISPPVSMVCRGNLAGNWEFFRMQWEDFEIATGLSAKTDKIRIATVRSVMGKECLQILCNLDISQEDREDVKKVLDSLEGHLKQQRNVVYERFVFGQAQQDQGENADQCVNRLRKLASTCEFGALTDELIRDRIVLGARDNGARARMFRETKLTLTKAVETLRISELSQSQLDSIGNEKPETVHFAQKKGKKYGQAKAERPGQANRGHK